MSNLVIALLAAIGIALIATMFFNGAPKRRTLFVARPILTENEREFYYRLRKALPGFEVLTQVSMSALLRPRTGLKGRDYGQARNQIAQKYVDYVICRIGSLEPVAIVELDDRTHRPDKDAERDALLNGAGYPVVRWQSRSKPSVAEIAATFSDFAESLDSTVPALPD